MQEIQDNGLRSYSKEVIELSEPRLFYPAKLSFRHKGQINSFPDKKKLKELIITGIL